MRAWCVSALLLLALTAVTAAAAEMSPVPFVLGSRYGRAAPRQITPRNDRFFMGSRYGKRAEGPVPPLASAGPPLACRYTGFGTLYSCQPATGPGRAGQTFMRIDDDTWLPGDR